MFSLPEQLHSTAYCICCLGNASPWQQQSCLETGEAEWPSVPFAETSPGKSIHSSASLSTQLGFQMPSLALQLVSSESCLQNLSCVQPILTLRAQLKRKRPCQALLLNGHTSGDEMNFYILR